VPFDRRTDVVGIFPNSATLLRLSACILIEADDEWQVSDRRSLGWRAVAARAFGCHSPQDSRWLLLPQTPAWRRMS
jgi:hypothetical protein